MGSSRPECDGRAAELRATELRNRPAEWGRGLSEAEYLDTEPVARFRCTGVAMAPSRIVRERLGELPAAEWRASRSTHRSDCRGAQLSTRSVWLFGARGAGGGR